MRGVDAFLKGMPGASLDALTVYGHQTRSWEADQASWKSLVGRGWPFKSTGPRSRASKRPAGKRC